MSRTRRLSDTDAIASRSVGGTAEGLHGSERRFRRNRALEKAMSEAIADNMPLPEVIQPIGKLAGDSSRGALRRELERK